MLTLTLAAKLAGTALMLSAVAAFIFTSKKREAARRRRISGQIAFVRFVRERIDRYLSPVSEILRDCDAAILADAFIGCEMSTYCDIDGMRAILRSGEFFSDGGAIFDAFLASLGTSYRESEIAACECCIGDLAEILESLKTSLPREGKSRGVLLFCLVAAIVIILF